MNESSVTSGSLRSLWNAMTSRPHGAHTGQPLLEGPLVSWCCPVMSEFATQICHWSASSARMKAIAPLRPGNSAAAGGGDRAMTASSTAALKQRENRMGRVRRRARVFPRQIVISDHAPLP